jgi:hypothetical protein
MKVLTTVKLPDLESERSLKERSLTDFLNSYNKNLPFKFPSATEAALLKFKEVYPSLFKGNVSWSLDKHRKKFMDWLPQYHRSIELQENN